MPRSLGIFGGTFDPPHVGHVALVQAAQVQLNLSQVHIIPAGVAPLRTQGPVASPAHRLAMCQRAFASFSWAVVDDRELRREGVSWSIDTARALAQEYPTARRFWILGADQLERLPQWRQVSELAQLVEFAVLSRQGSKVTVPPSLQGVIRVTVLNAPEVEVSSTLLRAALQRGELVRNGLPSEVARYIDDNRLYQS